MSSNIKITSTVVFVLLVIGCVNIFLYIGALFVVGEPPDAVGVVFSVLLVVFFVSRVFLGYTPVTFILLFMVIVNVLVWGLIDANYEPSRTPPTPSITRAPRRIPTSTPSILVQVNWKGVDKSGEDLKYANMQGANLEGANLQDTKLWEVNLVLANLVSADLSGARLWKANLQDANLQDANLRGANLLGAVLNGANLIGANLEGAIMSEITYDARTVFPDGSTPTRDTDLTRFTNPNHPNFWRPAPDENGDLPWWAEEKDE